MAVNLLTNKDCEFTAISISMASNENKDAVLATDVRQIAAPTRSAAELRLQPARFKTPFAPFDRGAGTECLEPGRPRGQAQATPGNEP
jgi:hypothetical protein